MRGKTPAHKRELLETEIAAIEQLYDEISLRLTGQQQLVLVYLRHAERNREDLATGLARANQNVHSLTTIQRLLDNQLTAKQTRLGRLPKPEHANGRKPT